MDKVLTIAGGLFVTIVLILFPILIYNKTQKEGTMCIRAFNWIIFVAAIGVGALGMHSGLTQLIQSETLVVVN